jgi:hypothetical protein
MAPQNSTTKEINSLKKLASGIGLILSHCLFSWHASVGYANVSCVMLVKEPLNNALLNRHSRASALLSGINLCAAWKSVVGEGETGWNLKRQLNFVKAPLPRAGCPGKFFPGKFFETSRKTSGA